MERLSDISISLLRILRSEKAQVIPFDRGLRPKAFALVGEKSLHGLVYCILYHKALSLTLFESYIASGKVLKCAMNVRGMML